MTFAELLQVVHNETSISVTRYDGGFKRTTLYQNKYHIHHDPALFCKHVEFISGGEVANRLIVVVR